MKKEIEDTIEENLDYVKQLVINEGDEELWLFYRDVIELMIGETDKWKQIAEELHAVIVCNEGREKYEQLADIAMEKFTEMWNKDQLEKL